MSQKLIIIMIVLISATVITANPLEEPFIQEISVDPPWIEILCWDPEDLIGLTFSTREGTAEILSADTTDDFVLVLDSTNTTGFYLHPDGDSIIFSFEYPLFCSCIGYGTYGESAGAPPPGSSIKANLYLVYDGDEFPEQRWFFSFPPEPSPGISDWNFLNNPSWGDSRLIINELSLNCDWLDGANFIELYNGGAEPILTDNYYFIGDAVYELPDNRLIYPDRFYVIDESDCPALFSSKNTDTFYLTRGHWTDDYFIVDQVGWSAAFSVNESFMRFPDGDVDWENWDDFRGYNTPTSYTFENGFPTRGAPNRHDCPGFVVIGARADSSGEGEAHIHWTDPIWDAQFDFAALVRSYTAYPETPADGELLYSGTAQEFTETFIPPADPVYYTVFACDLSGNYSTPTEESKTYIWFNAVGVDENDIPSNISYLNCYPNPFNAQTTISFSLTQPGDIEISIYDIAGRLVETLADEFYPSGNHSIVWRADGLASGIYFAKLRINGFYSAEKLVLLK